MPLKVALMGNTGKVGSRVAKKLLRRGHKVLGLARHTTNLVSQRKDMHMPQITYAMDPVHTAVHFSVRHMMVSNVRGEFTKISGTIKFDPDKIGRAHV